MALGRRHRRCGWPARRRSPSAARSASRHLRQGALSPRANASMAMRVIAGAAAIARHNPGCRSGSAAAWSTLMWPRRRPSRWCPSRPRHGDDAAADAVPTMMNQEVGQRALQPPQFASAIRSLVVHEHRRAEGLPQVVTDGEDVPCRHERRVDQLALEKSTGRARPGRCRSLAGPARTGRAEGASVPAPAPAHPAGGRRVFCVWLASTLRSGRH